MLLITAAIVDLVDAVFERPRWLATAATSLYLAGAGAAITAYLTGLQAGSTVYLPGMAHPVLDNHRRWALATTGYASLFALTRLVAQRAGLPRNRRHRLVLLALSIVGAVLVQQTAERGARLVYQHGVGVIAAPPPNPLAVLRLLWSTGASVPAHSVLPVRTA